MKSYYMRVALKDIRLNPTNPRQTRTPEMVEKKKASLKANGQLSPLKLRPTTTEEQKTDPTTYLLLGGELRYRAAKELGWTEVDALVISVTPEEADLVALMDNKGEDMHWLDWYQAIEKWVMIHPDLTQEEIANQLEVQQQVISKALKVLTLLSPSTREQIYKNFVNPEAKHKPSESTVVRLSDLGSLQKPLEELQAIMEKAFQVVVEHDMNESKAKSLVHWIKTGNSPESYGQKTENTPAQDPNDPNAGLWKDLPAKVVKVKWTPKGYVIRFLVAPSEGPTLVYGALANLEHLKGQAKEPENTLYRDSLKQVVEDGCSARAQEQALKKQEEENRLAAKKAKETLAAQKAEAKVQKAAAKEQTRLISLQAKAQNAKSAQETLDDHKAVVRQNVETVFGTGLLSDSLVQKGHSGDVRSAMKLAKTILVQTGKTPEEQQAFLQGFKGDLSRHVQLMKKAGGPLPGKTTPPPQTERSKTLSVSDPILSTVPENQTNQSETTVPARSTAKANPGILGRIKEAVEENLHITPESLAQDFIKNLGRTADYEERKGMRKLFKDLL